MTNLEIAINSIKDRIEDCKNNGNLFYINTVGINGENIQHISHECNGSFLLHETYHITLPSGEKIDIDYESKDRCNSFQIQPDRSCITVSCTNSSLNFSDAWDERY